MKKLGLTDDFAVKKALEMMEDEKVKLVSITDGGFKGPKHYKPGKGEREKG